MACIMGQNPQLFSKRVLLLERGKVSSLPNTPPEHYSNRVSAVSPASIEMFKKIFDRLLSRTGCVETYSVL
ncbi:hypothetical protein KIN20_013199 [Parelaphostrongylus tenuis]|uniref:Uncharacterized protein n=1 Tax=Parelaphostrongylus tenuis TaxID=148309 RepID=A0AAD5MXT6_PARTN|nr:hypothetical protein KIN20_013199 [Parelaphostrongylus tenuis]